MSLGGLAALVAAAFLSGGVSGHIPATPVSSDSLITHSSAPATLSPGVTSAVLRQVGPQRWQVALLMADTGRGCHAAADYWLEMSTPGTPVATAVRGHPAPRVLRPPPAAGSSCRVTVTFNGLRRVPSAAALDIEQAGKASTVTLTVSRAVSLYYYLWLPAITGAAMALVGLVLSLCFIRLYRVDGQPLTCCRRAFWSRPLSASGAWTVNDSWATNITALLTLVATILGTTAAVGAFFPGVAVDRFVVVNIVAGGIVAVAPLVFGVLYARWTKRNPGVMADATLTLPAPGAARIAALADAAGATLPRGTVVRLADGPVTRLRSDTRVLLEPATTVVLPGGTANLQPGTSVVISPGAQATLNAEGRMRLRGWWTPLLSRRPDISRAALVRLLAPTCAQLWQAAEIDLPGDGSVALPAGAAAAELPARTALEVTDGPRGRLARRTTVGLAPGATVTVSSDTQVRLASTGPVTMAGSATARLPDRAAAQQLPAPPERFSVPGGSTAILDPTAVARLADVSRAPAATIGVPSGASIALPGGATVTGLSGDLDGSQQVKPGQSLQVPPGLSIGVLGGTAIAIPGTTDIGVQAGAVLLLTGTNGNFTMPADDLTAAGGKKATDAHISYPVRIAATGGAKITATGVTDVTLPPATQSTAPYRGQEHSELLRERGLQVPPPGGNVMFATVGIVLAAAFVTMFGIGAQIGIAGVLAYGLSEASEVWRWVMLGVCAIIAVLVLWYSVTAIRALADPRPGSSISATGGTSFTL